MAKEKTPEEASKLFYSIIKASVSPKATGAKQNKNKTNPNKGKGLEGGQEGHG